MSLKRRTLFLAELRESIAMALQAITAHKLRSTLTLLGVLIGVFSIIVVMTALRVMQGDIEDKLSQLGINCFVIQKRPGLMFNDADWQRVARRKNITYQNGQRIQERLTMAASVGIETMFWGGQIETQFAKTAPNVMLFGETPGSFPVRNWIIDEGRIISEADVDGTRDVVVLGATVAKTVFPFGSALGQRLKINGINYTVIGVLAAKGASLGGSQDNLAIVPVTTGMNRFGRWSRSLSILVQARDRSVFDDTVDEARGAMRIIRKTLPKDPDDFDIVSNESLIEQFKKFTQVVRLGVAGISSIALIAAGIGIMNIMLVSVTERTREIGIRRAVGAKKRNIMTQFILEAIMLCEVGGILGVGLGIAGGNATAFLLKLPAVIPFDWAVIGLLICSVVGIIFGTYPAWKAANLDPIESLRYE
ncbi:MAG: Macrolide export ATP-binding/permease protein MacB [Verrucomicrobiota bacterium]|jgi:putative ABC transport system permease protein